MWFDTFAVSPLVFLGVHKIVNEQKYILYIATLALAVIFNFYFALFVCIFTALLFFVLCISQKLAPQDIIKKLVIMGACTVVALGMTAFISLPTVTALQSIYRQTTELPTGFYRPHSIATLLGNFIAFTPTTLRDSHFLTGHPPNLYSGMLGLMFLPLFMMSKKIDKKERIAYFVVLAFITISTNMDTLHYMWHGFTVTNSLNSRFTFLISFILMYMSYKIYMIKMEEGFTKKDVMIMTLGASAFIAFAYFSEHQQGVHVFWSILLTGVYVAIFTILSKINIMEQKDIAKALTLSLAVVMIAELSIVSFLGVQNNNTTSRDDLWSAVNVHEVLTHRQPMGDDFYRTEFTRMWASNDSLMYRSEEVMFGTSVFSSMVNADVNKFMQGIGFTGNLAGNAYHYYETSPLTNAFLSIRYLVDRTNTPAGDGYFFSRVEQDGFVVLMENNYHLPLGFMVRPEVAEWYTSMNDPFTAQNALFTASTGLQYDLFHTFPITYHSENGEFRFSHTMAQDGDFYTFINLHGKDSLRVFSDERSLRSVSTPRAHIMHAGTFAAGETAIVETTIAGHTGERTITGAVIDRELFARGYEILASQPFVITDFDYTRITGTVNVLEDGLLYTSIPNIGNWRVFVNGVEREVTLIGEAMTGVMLEAGTHEVEFRYHNRSFTIGASVSAISLVIFIGAIKIQKKFGQTQN